MITVCLLLIMFMAYVQELLIFMKITTEFTNFGCKFCLVGRPNNNNSLGFWL